MLGKKTPLGRASAPSYDVFISYAHEDRDFVAQLRDWLMAAGFSVWFDEERMRAGDSVQEQIYQALLSSKWAIFVISETSLTSRWSRYELRTFSEECTAKRKIAILRSVLSPGRIPVYLGDDLQLLWYDERESDFSKFWLLYCGLRGQDADRRDEWERKGREICGKGGVGPRLIPGTQVEKEWRAARVARWSKGRAVWGCDRTDQWMKIEIHAAKPEHEVLLVPGRRGEGHSYFLDMVGDCFPEAPERWVREVFWGAKIPRDREEFFRALAQTLRCRSPEKDALTDVLHRWLRDRNLILVHRPVIPASLRDEVLALYFTRWLAELVPMPGTTRGVLKVIQGVDWPPTALSRSLLRRLDQSEARLQPPSLEKETTEALKKLRAKADHRLPIFILPFLKPITRRHVLTWAESLPKVLVSEPKEFVQDVLAGAQNSADVLNRIVERLCITEERE